PFAGRGVPPDVLFPLRPGPACRVRRGAVIEDAPVAGPRESPLRLDIVVRRPAAAARHVFLRLREDPGVDPDPTGGGAIGLELLEIVNLLAFLAGVSVHYLQYHLLLGLGL